jgi:hypothetical protein
VPVYPNVCRRVWSFDRSALFFDNFCPTGAAVKSIVVAVPVVDVVVGDVLSVVDFFVVLFTGFASADFADGP